MASTALITAPRNALSSNDVDTLDGGASWRADGVLHGTRMGFVGQVQRTDAFHHLCGQTVGGGALQTVFHARVAERLDVHVGECGRAAGDAHADAHMRGVDAFDEADR